jgi:hypothetical protein
MEVIFGKYFCIYLIYAILNPLKTIVNLRDFHNFFQIFQNLNYSIQPDPQIYSFYLVINLIHYL